MVETIFNAGEALLWLVFAVIVAVRFHGAPRTVRQTARALAMFFVLFGVSDIIEMQTGAWWRPMGLLIFKAVCLAGLTCCFIALLRAMRADATHEPKNQSRMSKENQKPKSKSNRDF